MNLGELITETVNVSSKELDSMATVDLLCCINGEDKNVPLAVGKEIPSIAMAVDKISEKMRAGGRLIYVGCGTSGRLGVLDASECPVTFGVPEGTVIGLIAGGQRAVFESQEKVEDSYEVPVADLKQKNLTSGDSVVGITASGRTPYVVGAVRYARDLGCLTVGISCNRNSELSQSVEITICPVVGPEILTGSTRMKAGTAQKLILNMISTGVFVRLGKCYGNLMIDVRGWACEKLKDRARRILRQIAECEEGVAEKLLQETGYELKPAVLMALAGCDLAQAVECLAKNQGDVRKALKCT